MARTVAELAGSGGSARVVRLGRVVRVLETRATRFGESPLRVLVEWRGTGRAVEAGLRDDDIVLWDVP